MSEITTDHDALLTHVAVSGREVIDVGCGAGAMVRWLQTAGANAVGIECGVEALATARATDPHNSDSYVEGVGQNLPVGDGSADVVTFFRSLHHVPEGEMLGALAEAYRVLKPGGTAYVVEPVPAGPSFEVVRLVDDETYVRGLAQDAISQATELGFGPPITSSYVTQSQFADTDAWEAMMIGVSPDRADKVAEMRSEIHDRFYEHGTKTDSGWTFTSEQRVAVLTKPA